MNDMPNTEQGKGGVSVEDDIAHACERINNMHSQAVGFGHLSATNGPHLELAKQYSAESCQEIIDLFITERRFRETVESALSAAQGECERCRNALTFAEASIRAVCGEVEDDSVFEDYAEQLFPKIYSVLESMQKTLKELTHE